jgi:hypothetical protein
MVAVPAVNPETIPEDEPMLAIPELMLHTPPADVSVRVVEEAVQTLSTPFIGPGEGLTVMLLVTWQPAASV